MYLKWSVITLAYKYSFFAYIDRANSQGPTGLTPKRGLQLQLVKNGDISMVLLTWLFMVNSVRGSQFIQLSQVKLIKAYRYLFITALIILVWLSILGYYIELGLRVTFRRQFRRRQKLEINEELLSEIIVLGALYSLYIVWTNALMSSLVFRLVIRIKCLIFVRRLITTKIYLYVLLLWRHLGRLIIQLMEVL